ncbi:MAG: MFS transporter [Lentisphaeria bacterium]|nr:MFS transporter [Lentisphaeria bacterium]
MNMREHWKNLCEVKYTAGTLHYSTLGIVRTIFFLLWGTFFFALLEYVLVPTLLPLSFKQLGTSGALMGIMLGSVPSAINFFMNPILSTMSDRTRTKLGRRIPYLLYTIPLVTLSCVALGWIPELTLLFCKVIPADPKSTALVLLCILTVIFYVTGLFGGSIGCYLPPDVLPFSFIGRFQAASSIVISGASFAFNYYLMPYAQTHSKWLFTGIGIAFAFCYGLMCIMVKEGEYPPPEKEDGGEKSSLAGKVFRSFTGYFKECFSEHFFVLLFMGIAVTQVSTRCRGIFNIIFATKDLALTTAQYGYITAVGSLVSLGVSLCGIFWIDRVNPLLVYMGSGIPILLLNVWGFFAVHDYQSFFLVGVMITIAYSVQNLGFVPAMMLVLPKEKFGQYSSANAMVCCIVSILGSYFCGIAVDCFGNRFIYGWDFFFTILATAILWKNYCDWKKRSGAASGKKS